MSRGALRALECQHGRLQQLVIVLYTESILLYKVAKELCNNGSLQRNCMRAYAFVTQQPCLQARGIINKLTSIQLLLIMDRWAAVPRFALV
jgi:hypothetical protein